MEFTIILSGIVMVSVIVMFSIVSIIKKNEEKKNRVSEKVQTAQDFTNVENIEDMFLYTKDHYIFSYIKVQSITIGLLTESEKLTLARNMTNEFSQEREPFKFIAISRPVDIAPLIAEYSELLLNSTEQVQKELLRNEIRVISDFSLSGEVVEREFYYILWCKDGESAQVDLRKRTRDLASRIESTGISCSILNENEIIKLCNLVNNPAFAAVEAVSQEATIPFIQLYK